MKSDYLVHALIALSVSGSLVSITHAETTTDKQDDVMIEVQGTMLEKLNDKQALAKLHREVREGLRPLSDEEKAYQTFKKKWGGSTAVSPSLLTLNPEAAPYYSHSVSLTQMSQPNNYYCGPATAVEILRSYGNSQGKSLSMSEAATSLYTTEANGTPWSKGTAFGTYVYPMADTLDYYSDAVNNYAPFPHPNSTDFGNSIVYTIEKGYPVAANVVEPASTYPRLTGHPASLTIYHWVAVYGYNKNGDSAMYADSASGGTGISFDTSSIPRYSELNNSAWSSLVSQRGIIY